MSGAGAAAMLACAAVASVVLNGNAAKSKSKASVRLVATRAMPAATPAAMPVAQPEPTPAPPAAPVAIAPAVLEMTMSSAAPSVVQSPLTPVSVVETTATETPTWGSTSVRRGLAARVIGGARHTCRSRSARHATSSSTSGRRSIGAQLQRQSEQPVWEPVNAPYDLSRVRAQIAFGLRTASGQRTQSVRESKTQSASTAESDSAGVCSKTISNMTFVMYVFLHESHHDLLDPSC